MRGDSCSHNPQLSLSPTNSSFHPSQSLPPRPLQPVDIPEPDYGGLDNIAYTEEEEGENVYEVPGGGEEDIARDGNL